MTLLPRPEPGPPAPFLLPEKDTLRLDNGVHATLVAAGSVPKVAIRLVIRLGAVNVPQGQTWLEHLVSEYLKQGTRMRTADELASAVADIGGELSVDIDDDTTTIDAEVLSEHAPTLVRLLAEVAREPRFPASELPRLQSDLRRRLDLARTQPQVLTVARFHAALYGDHPYGRVLTDAATIDGFTVEGARGFFEEGAGAQRSHLYVGGVFDAASVREAIEASFTDWESGPEPLHTPPSPESERVIHLVDRPGSEQSTIYLGLPVPDPTDADYVSLIVTNALLGGSFYSRITLNLREEKGYTYSPHSLLSVRYRDAHWLEAADVTTAVTGASLQEIFAEVDRLRAEPPSAEELAGIQQYVVGTHVLRHATPNGILNQLAFLDLHGLGDEYAETYVDRVQAMTPGDVQRIAVDYLRPDDMTIAITGDAAQIREQIEPYGRIVT